MIKQPIAGVSPSKLGEVTVMTVWPSIAATPLGRFLGRLYRIPYLGKLIALASVTAFPIALGLFFFMLAPGFCRRYRLTNRRVIVEQGLKPTDERSVSLDRFDNIDVVVLPGQEWYPAGELIFRLGNVETFRLSGVPRPETFKHTCIKAQQSFVGVEKARRAGAAV